MPTDRARAFNLSPTFESPNGWSSGYALAVGHGPGVVVGPGGGSPSVFGQSFPTKSGQQFKVVAQASSVDAPKAIANVQVNWFGKNGGYISTSQEPFKVTPSAREYQITVVAPPGAIQGVLYVVPGGKKDLVRYTEMSLIRLKPIRDFMAFEFAGVKGQNLMVSGTALLVLALLYAYFRQSLFKAGALLFGGVGGRIAKLFPILALVLCGVLFAFLEGPYEQHYDSSWHQAVVDGLMKWNDASLDLGGNAMHNFGIQHVMKPQFSPGTLVGYVSGENHRTQVEGAFWAIVMFGLLSRLGVLAGARLGDASAASLVAVFYFWIPNLSDEAITLNATLGLKWQAVAMACLMSLFCFSRIGRRASARASQAGWLGGLAITVLWVFAAYPETVVFFVLSTSGLCLGAILGSEDRQERLWKIAAAAGLAVALLMLGVHHFVLNLFEYTPQMYYRNALYNQDFKSLFFNNTCLLMSAGTLGGLKIVVFFVLGGIGLFAASRCGNRYARQLVFAALSLEVSVVLFSGINALFRLVPLTFTYVEQMGLAVFALAAGVGFWSVLRAGLRLIPWLYERLAPAGAHTSDLVPQARREEAEHALPYLALLGIVAFVFHQQASQINFFRGWPPRTDSAPAKIQAKELAIAPGDRFKGKSLTLLGMGNSGPALWGSNAFPTIYAKYREELGNDLTNDAEAAGIPVLNEYAHWISPPMVALLATAFYRPGDHIDRGAQAPRVFRPNLGRLMGVGLVVSDEALPGETELYHGLAGDHPVFLHRIVGTNLGQYSPTRIRVAANAAEILDQLQAGDFDGSTLAIVEAPITSALVPADGVSVRLLRGPKIHVEATSAGTSLLVLPFDYSHCLQADGRGLRAVIPVDLALTGLVISGKASLDITYRYGLIGGTSCRKQDLDRIKAMHLDEAASGRVFFAVKRAGNSP